MLTITVLRLLANAILSAEPSVDAIADRLSYVLDRKDRWVRSLALRYTASFPKKAVPGVVRSSDSCVAIPASRLLPATLIAQYVSPGGSPDRRPCALQLRPRDGQFLPSPRLERWPSG
jgi:hypothetical protein